MRKLYFYSLSLATIASVAFSGCSESGDSNLIDNLTSDADEKQTYIVHVEDGIVLKATVTDEENNTATEIGDGDYEFETEPVGVITADGGIDVGEDNVSGTSDDINLTECGVKFRAPNHYRNISHMSEMVVGYKEHKHDENITYEDAEESIAQYYEINTTVLEDRPSRVKEDHAREIVDNHKINHTNKENFKTHLHGDFDHIEVVRAETDDTEADDTEADDTEADDTEADDTETDDTEADDTETDDTEADDTEADDTEADDTEADDTETDDTEADDN